MGGARCIYQGEQKCTWGFGGKLKETDHMKELGSGRIILKWVLIRWGNVDQTYLIQDKDIWWAVVNGNGTLGLIKQGIC